MTAATMSPGQRVGDGVRVTFPRVLKSEWVRLRSVRSTWITLFSTAVLIVGLAALSCALRASHWPPPNPAEFADFDPILQSTGPGTFLAQLVVGVLGVLVVTGEYSSGMIRATITSVPRRIPVLVARALLFAGFTFVVLFSFVLAGFLLGQQLLSSKHIETTLGGPNALRCVVGSALYVVGIGLLGMGIGWLLRHTAGAISTLFGLLLIAPLIVHFLPEPWPENVTKFLPGGFGEAAGNAIWNPHPGHQSLSPWTGFGVLMAYVVGVLIVAALLLRARDV